MLIWQLWLKPCKKGVKSEESYTISLRKQYAWAAVIKDMLYCYMPKLIIENSSIVLSDSEEFHEWEECFPAVPGVTRCLEWKGKDNRSMIDPLPLTIAATTRLKKPDSNYGNDQDLLAGLH